MHAVAIVTNQRFGHKGSRHSMEMGHVMDTVLIDL